MEYQYLDTEAEILEHIARLNNLDKNYIVLDTETTSKDPWKAELVDIQISGVQDNSAVMFPARFSSLLKAISEKKILVAQNFKYDFIVLHRYKAMLTYRDYTWHDTMHLHHLYNENASHSLDSMVESLYGSDVQYKGDFWEKYSSYLDAPFEERLEYGCMDIVYTDLVYRDLFDQVDFKLFDHTMKLARSLVDTEIHGIKVDEKKLVDLGVELTSKIEDLKKTMREHVNEECEIIELESYAEELGKRKTQKGKERVVKPTFSFSSSKQLGKLLYEKLKLPPQKTRKGSWKTDRDAIDEIRLLHPVCEHISECNRFNTYYSTFIKGIAERLNCGYIHPEFKVSGTKTGRISHSNPNMGNMPAKDPEWSKIRNIFLPESDEYIVKSDYSQLEVCVEAHYTQDKNLLKIVYDGVSKHDITNEELKLNDRGMAKTLNFAMQYWCQPFKISQIIGCSKREAEYIWNKYWEIYSGPKKLKEYTDSLVDAGKPIVSMFGRKRHFPVTYREHWDKTYRQAYNALIQGTGGDITSMAFYRMWQWFKETGYGRTGWTIHDELVTFAIKEYNNLVVDKLSKTMVQIGEDVNLSVPLSVDTEGKLTFWRK